MSNTTHPTLQDPARDRFVAVNGLNLHVREWGSDQAPPLVLLHAGGCHAHWWNAVAGPLANRYRVIAPDLRGHGDSDRSATGDYTFDAHVADLAALIEALTLQDVRLVGHSLGAYVGLVYASQRPAALAALMVADMLCELDGPVLERVHEASRKPSPSFASRAEAEARFRLQPPETVAPAEVLAALTAEAVTAMPDGQFGFKFDRRAMGHPAVRAWDFAPNVTCRTVVVRGALSTLMSSEHAARLVTMLPDAELREIAGTYHHIMLDNPAAFAAVLDEFLDRTTAALP